MEWGFASVSRFRLALVSGVASFGEATVELTRTECDMVAELTERYGHVVAAADLLRFVDVGGLGAVTPRASATALVDSHIRRINGKLTGGFGRLVAVRAVYGKGYRLWVEDRLEARSLVLETQEMTALLGGDTAQLTLRPMNALAVLIEAYPERASWARLTRAVGAVADHAVVEVVELLIRELSEGLGERVRVEGSMTTSYGLVLPTAMGPLPSGAAAAGRSDAAGKGLSRAGSLWFHPGTRSVAFAHETAELTPRESELLILLVDAFPRTAPTEHLLARLEGVDRKLLRVIAHRLRRKLRSLGGDPPHCGVDAVIGVGYRLVVNDPRGA